MATTALAISTKLGASPEMITEEARAKKATA
jgi:hypothetical protein